MGDQPPQHLFGHSPPYSTGGMHEQGYHQSNALTINPVNAVSSNSIVDPNNSISSSHQTPIFYDQTSMYSHEILPIAATPNPIQQQQSYMQQGSFSQTTLSPPTHQQSHITIQQPTNQMYGENPAGHSGAGSTISNMLSFQPIPQDQMFKTNATAKPMITPAAAAAPVQQPPTLHPNFQASTPPPLSHLQSLNMYQQSQQVHQAGAPPTNVLPTPKGMGGKAGQTFKTPTNNKLHKTRSPKKKLSPQAPPGSAKSAATTPQFVTEPSLNQSVESPIPMQESSPPGFSGLPPPQALQGGTTFPKLKDLVGRLLLCTLDAFADKEFGEKTLMNLARKLSTGNVSKAEEPVLQVWEKAIQQKDGNSGCVCIQRPREGRITVTKSGTGNSGSKKVFPQIVLCQMFRFPNIVFHHDIKPSEHCQNAAAVKPNTLNPGGESGDGSSSNEIDGSATDVICLNPYHYIISPEAEARFMKQDKKAAKEALKEAGLQQQVTASNQPPSTATLSSQIPKPSTQQSNIQLPLANKRKTPVKKTTAPKIDGSQTFDNSVKFKPTIPVQPEVVELSSDDEESDDEIHHFMDDGVDYVKLWEEKAAIPTRSSGSAIEELDEKKLFDEIKFLSWSNENNKFMKTEDVILEELKVYEEFKSLIISGKYIDAINQAKQKRDQTLKEKMEDSSNAILSENNKNRSLSDKKVVERNSDSQMEEEQKTSNEGSSSRHHVNDEPDIILESITSHEPLYQKEDTTNSALGNRLEEHQFLAPINITTTASDKTLSSAFVEEDDSCDTVGNSLSMNLLTPSTSGTGATSTSQNVLAGGGSSVQESATSDEDNVIQDLLEDIRGSFERQFDDEFNFDQRPAKNDSVSAVGASSDHHRVTIPSGGVSPTSFGVNIESDFNINPEEAAEVAAAVADMDIPDSEFLNAGTISQEEFDSLSNFLGNAGRSLHSSTNSTPHFNNPLQQQGQLSEANQQQNTFQFQSPPHSQNPQFDLFQHPSNSSQDFQF